MLITPQLDRCLTDDFFALGFILCFSSCPWMSLVVYLGEVLKVKVRIYLSCADICMPQ